MTQLLGPAHRSGKLQLELVYVIGSVAALAVILFFAQQSARHGTARRDTDLKSVEPLLQLELPHAAKPVQEKVANLHARLREHPEDSKTLATLAMTFMAYDLKTSAIPCLELLALREPQDYRWPYLLGHCRMFTEPEKAIEHFRKATQLNPEYVPAQMLLAEVLLANGRTEETQLLLEQHLPESIRNHPWVAWQKARLYSITGRFAEGAQLLEQLRAKEIVSRSLLRQLLMVKHRLDKDADLSSLSEELDRCSQELLAWECHVIQAVRAEKLDYQMVAMNAQHALARRNLRGAIDIYKKAMEEDPESPELMVGLAQVWLQAGDLERADGILQMAESREQGSMQILLQRARIAVLRREFRKAEELCRTALDVKPDSTDAWYVMAVIQNEQKQPEAAKASVRKALRFDPLNPDAQRLSGELAEN